MHLPTFVNALLAVTTTALAPNIRERGSKCALSTTTMTGATGATSLSGPFNLEVSGDTRKTSLNGRIATLIFSTIPKSDGGKGVLIEFAAPTTKQAIDFYLEGTSLVYDNNGTYDAAYEVAPAKGPSGYILLGPVPEDPVTDLVCALDKTTCALKCTVDTFSFNCLASPGVEPEWRITKNAAVAGPGCQQFVPKVIPV